ncbi:hypothetical protein; putative signal peptide [Bradyrhizobium sp. ORS 278]|uniref:beta strand repeat-containing protein n=1 Tax=Bradyrhizobium sp. (strain ORS 278) TaxID=114615 RepID=UPI00015084EE|nr:hypothetical protein [Bradyrhizobium sp. ORS 278]CAL80029.1 hypothetical protein; putative signal peptide [Bradyrhizobium sp. ORS 278]
MRALLLGVMLAGVASAAVAQDWGNMAIISSTLGNNTNRLCIGDHSRAGDIGCPTYAPSLTTAGDLTVSGMVSAAAFVGDGSGLTNIGAAGRSDRIVSGTGSATSMVAISDTGIISVTQNGTNTAYFHPSMGLVTVGVSSTGPISGTSGYLSGGLTIVNNPIYMNSLQGMYWGNNSNNSITGHATQKYITFYTSGTEAMRIVSSGYVGIGTSTPGNLLELLTASNVNGLQIRRTGSLTNNAAILGFRNSASASSTNSADIRAIRINSPQAGDTALTFNVTSNLALAEFMRIDSTGNVGIGTATPTTALEVSGTISATNFVGNGSGLTGVVAGSSDRIVSGTGNATSMVAISTTGIISVTQNGTNTAYFHPQLGLVAVGISTTGPVSATELYSSDEVNAVRWFRTAYGLGTGALGSGTPQTRIDLATPNTMGLFSGGQQNVSLTSGTIILTTSGTEAMRIVSSGNVGIGTATPASKLEVNGSAKINGSGTFGGGSNYVYISYNGPVGGAANVMGGGAYPLVLGTGSTERMRITSTGLVGIGTLTPTTALEVSGTISATNFVGNGSGLTGVVANNNDRIVSGSINMIAEQTSGTVRVSGTLALNNTGNEVCDAAHYYTLRINPTTQRLEMCRP